MMNNENVSKWSVWWRVDSIARLQASFSVIFFLYSLHTAICCWEKFPKSETPSNFQVVTLTLVGAVCMGLVAVVPTVVIPVAGPVVWDAAPTVALKLSAWARVTTACFITVVAAVVIWKTNTVKQHLLSSVMRRPVTQKWIINMQKLGFWLFSQLTW